MLFCLRALNGSAEPIGAQLVLVLLRPNSLFTYTNWHNIYLLLANCVSRWACVTTSDKNSGNTEAIRRGAVILKGSRDSGTHSPWLRACYYLDRLLIKGKRGVERGGDG
jgi:hypothetical protein